MNNPDLVRPSGAPCCDEKAAGAIVRSAHSIDMQAHARLADQVQKMRYLSRLREFIASDLHP